MQRFMIGFVMMSLALLGGAPAQATLLGPEHSGICGGDCEIPGIAEVRDHVEAVHDTIQGKWEEITQEVEARIGRILEREFPWDGWEFPGERPDPDELCSRLAQGVWDGLPGWEWDKEEILAHIREILDRELGDPETITVDLDSGGVSSTAVPEPGSLLLLASGLGGLWGLSSRRRS